LERHDKAENTVPLYHVDRKKSSACTYILIIYNLSVSFVAVKSIQRRVVRCEKKEDASN
jgi:hypothetical protein